MDRKHDTLKTSSEISSLAAQLNAQNQAYVLNTINALLFSQQVNEKETLYSKKSV